MPCANATAAAAAMMGMNRTTSEASGDDDDDGMEGDRIYFSIIVAVVLFIVLLLVFDFVRTRLWWVYEPRLHHAAYKDRTPPPPGRGLFKWVVAVMKLWSDEDFLMYGGVDGLVMIYFLRFATDQCLFASVVGLLVLVPAYHTGRGLYAGDGDDDGAAAREWSFSETTVQNIRCRFDVAEELGENPLFPECRNGRSQFRFALVVACAWLFTLRALAKLAENYQQFVHLRHWYLTSGLSRRAPGIEAQRALTVKVENLPEGLRTMDKVKKKFEKLCGPGSVHSAHVMVDGLKDLDGLCAQRNKAQDALEDAISKRAKLAAAWNSTAGLGGPDQTSEFSSSVTSKSIRLIFGRIDCSRRVLEARPKRLRRNCRIRAH